MWGAFSWTSRYNYSLTLTERIFFLVRWLILQKLTDRLTLLQSEYIYNYLYMYKYLHIPGEPKKWTILLFTILVVWQFLAGFCLTHLMLCDCDIEEKDLLLLYFKIGPQRDNRVKVSAFFSCGTQSEWSHTLVGLAQPSTQSRSKRMNDGEGVNRRAMQQTPNVAHSFGSGIADKKKIINEWLKTQ